MPQTSTQTMLALLGLLVIGAALILLFFRDIPANNSQMIGVVLGYVSGWVSAAYSYFFGSTKTSQTKDDTIKSLAETASTGTGGQTTTTTIERKATP